MAKLIHYPYSNLCLKEIAAIEVPINIVVQYNHKSPTNPESNAVATSRDSSMLQI
jgi:hypothetical protein